MKLYYAFVISITMSCRNTTPINTSDLALKQPGGFGPPSLAKSLRTFNPKKQVFKHVLDLICKLGGGLKVLGNLILSNDF